MGFPPSSGILEMRKCQDQPAAVWGRLHFCLFRDPLRGFQMECTSTRWLVGACPLPGPTKRYRGQGSGNGPLASLLCRCHCVTPQSPRAPHTNCTWSEMICPLPVPEPTQPKAASSKAGEVSTRGSEVAKGWCTWACCTPKSSLWSSNSHLHQD